MRTKTRIAVVCVALLPVLQVRGAEQEARQRANSRQVYAYYTAEQALAMARENGKPIFVISVRGNDCAGGL